MTSSLSITPLLLRSTHAKVESAETVPGGQNARDH